MTRSRKNESREVNTHWFKACKDRITHLISKLRRICIQIINVQRSMMMNTQLTIVHHFGTLRMSCQLFGQLVRSLARYLVAVSQDQRRNRAELWTEEIDQGFERVDIVLISLAHHTDEDDDVQGTNSTIIEQFVQQSKKLFVCSCFVGIVSNFAQTRCVDDVECVLSTIIVGCQCELFVGGLARL